MSRLEGKAPDGKGGINEQAIDAEGRAHVRAVQETDLAHSIDQGLGYAFYSTYSCTGGEEVWSLQNDGADIHVARIIVSLAASGIVTIMRKTSGTPAGTPMIGRNLTLGRPVMEDVTAFGSASVTGAVDGEELVGHDLPTSAPFIFALEGLIIPRTECLFVRAATSGIVHVAGLAYRV